MTGNEEFIQDFLVECEENLDQLDRDLVALEEDPRDPERLASIFRTIHTIKGTSGFFGFAKLGAIAHAGEGLLSRLRAGEIVLNAEITTGLLALVDAIRSILASIAADGHEGSGDYAALAARLTQLMVAATVSAPEPVLAAVNGGSRESAEVGEGGEPSAADESSRLVADEAAGGARPDSVREAAAAGGAPATRSGSGPADAERGAAAAARDGGEEAAAEAAIEGAQPDGAWVRETGDGDEGKSAAVAVAATEASIRVDVTLLDQLMNLVGELVLARNQIRPFGEVVQDRVFTNAAQQLDHITSELQEGIMKTRMQPIERLWSRFPRVVRDLARAEEKLVHLEMRGVETELDRTLLDAIKDPLTHLIRNAVDHGIEVPAVRRERGKSETGHILLSAFHEGGVVNIEVSDDGGGIDPERVRDRALRLGLVSRDQVRAMTDRQLMQLIFLPGLSTADRVTDISGRGVGMDVVKTNIDRIGGNVTIESRAGEGTTLRIQIPLTLAIIPALIVTSEGERFAIPQVSLREIITLYDSGSAHGIEWIGSAQVYRLRGELLPLVELHKLLRLPPLRARTGEEFAHVVVLEAVDQRFGLIVDAIGNTEEIVVKPLHKALAPLRVFSGATIMDDGRVALILDVVGVARTANIIETAQRQVAKAALVEEEGLADVPYVEPDEFLVSETTPGHNVAIPLGDVARLEELPVALIDTADGQMIVPYHGHLMPLLKLGGFDPRTRNEMVPVVVHAIADRHVGFLVNRILDVARASQGLDTSRKRVGVLGRALIDGHVIEVADVHALALATGVADGVAAGQEVLR